MPSPPLCLTWVELVVEVEVVVEVVIAKHSTKLSNRQGPVK